MKKEEILHEIDYSELTSNFSDPRLTKNSTTTVFYKTEMCGYSIRAIDDDYLCKYDEFFKLLSLYADNINTTKDLDLYIIKLSKYIERKHVEECTVEEINNEIKHTIVHINNANMLLDEVKFIEELS